MAATHPAKNSVPGKVLCSEASPNQFLSKLRGRKTRSFGKGDTFARLPRIWSKATCCLFYPQMMTAKTFRKNVVPTKSPIFCWKPFLNEDIVSKPLFRNIAWLCLISFLLVGLKWSRVWSARASSRTRQSLTKLCSPQAVFFTNQLTGSGGYHGT